MTEAADDNLVWSVTTLLKAGTPRGDALVGWAAKVTAEAALEYRAAINTMMEQEPPQRDAALEMLTKARFRKTKLAMARGTDVHAAAEAINLGLEPPADFPAALLPWVEQYRLFLSDFKPTFRLAEAPVFNLTHRYAGTLDSIVEIDGKSYLLDVKTHDKDPDASSRPPYPDIALQLVAYRNAELVGIGEVTRREIYGRRYYVYEPESASYVDMPQVDGALALAISPYDYRLVPVRVDDEIFTQFLYVKEVARWNLQVSKTVLGPQVTKRGDD